VLSFGFEAREQNCFDRVVAVAVAIVVFVVGVALGGLVGALLEIIDHACQIVHSLCCRSHFNQSVVVKARDNNPGLS
jgi:hypothetical protein